jgi:ribose transport system ATP-binding protein
MPALLRLKGISKQYPGVRALDGVGFELNAGEVHCLVGENGAGKSTLMKILSGALSKDSGEIIIDGQKAEIHSPSDALKYGIGIIYQDFKLVPELSVAENIFLGKEPMRTRVPLIDYATMHRSARLQLAQLGEELTTTVPVRTLSVGQQQVVEIAKAISQKVTILALDEPSAALTERELVNLFAIIRRLTLEGVGVIYISHRLEEIFQIGDRVTVLRDGMTVNTCRVAEADRKSLIRWMVGRELEDEYPRIELTLGEELFRVENIHAGILSGINFSLHRGEILGFAGLVGAGRTELARIIFGADVKESGKIFLHGKEIAPRSPREAIDLGIGLLTEDRNRFGLIPEMNVIENISLSSLADLLRGPFLDTLKESEKAQLLIEQLRIKTPNGREIVENLSGGNRQKVILARWLLTKSKVLIFDEPTSGIDVGAKYEIYSLIGRLADEGVGIVLISSDLPELLGVCSRIIVMHDGYITGELQKGEATQEKIMALAMLALNEVKSER